MVVPVLKSALSMFSRLVASLYWCVSRFGFPYRACPCNERAC